MDLLKFNPPASFTFTVPAGKEYPLGGTGRRIYIKEASYSNFDVKFDAGSWVPADLAIGFSVPLYMEPFKRVTFKNNNAVDIVLTVIVTELGVEDHRTNIINSRDGSAASMVPNVCNFLGAIIADGDLAIPADPNRDCLVFSYQQADEAAGLILYSDAAKTKQVAMIQQLAGASNGQATPLTFRFKGPLWAYSFYASADWNVHSLCFG